MLFGLWFDFSGKFRTALAQVPSDCRVAKLYGHFPVLLLLDLTSALATVDHFLLLQILSCLGFSPVLLYFQSLAVYPKAVIDYPLFSLHFLLNNLLLACDLGYLVYTAESQYCISSPTVSVSSRPLHGLQGPLWSGPGSCFYWDPLTHCCSHTGIVSGPHVCWTPVPIRALAVSSSLNPLLVQETVALLALSAATSESLCRLPSGSLSESLHPIHHFF